MALPRAIFRFVVLAITPAKQIVEVPDAIQVGTTLGLSTVLTFAANGLAGIPIVVAVPSLAACLFLWAGIRLQMRVDQQPCLEFSEPEETDEEVDFGHCQHWRIRLRNIQPASSARDVKVSLTTDPTLTLTRAPLPLFALNQSTPIPLTFTIPYSHELVFNVLSYNPYDHIFYFWRADTIQEQVGPEFMIQDKGDIMALNSAIDEAEGLWLIARAVSGDGQLSTEACYSLKAELRAFSTTPGAQLVLSRISQR